MDKPGMREYTTSLESVIDNKLKKWKKGERIENGEAVQMTWQFEQTYIIVNMFWEDGKETITLQFIGPRAEHKYTWHGLNDKSFNRVLDRIGNLTQIIMHPPIEPAY